MTYYNPKITLYFYYKDSPCPEKTPPEIDNIMDIDDMHNDPYLVVDNKVKIISAYFHRRLYDFVHRTIRDHASKKNLMHLYDIWHHSNLNQILQITKPWSCYNTIYKCTGGWKNVYSNTNALHNAVLNNLHLDIERNEIIIIAFKWYGGQCRRLMQDFDCFVCVYKGHYRYLTKLLTKPRLFDNMESVYSVECTSFHSLPSYYLVYGQKEHMRKWSLDVAKIHMREININDYILPENLAFIADATKDMCCFQLTDVSKQPITPHKKCLPFTQLGYKAAQIHSDNIITEKNKIDIYQQLLSYFIWAPPHYNTIEPTEQQLFHLFHLHRSYWLGEDTLNE